MTYPAVRFPSKPPADYVQCAGTTQTEHQCRRGARLGSQYCPQHAPGMTDREAAEMLERMAIGGDGAARDRTIDRLITRSHLHGVEIAREALRVSRLRHERVKTAIQRLDLDAAFRSAPATPSDPP
ncbi:MAG TPA: hypothetical protein VGL39_27705 [Jatrophihabitantaceae bacterium]|jgi:hypothetical protein